MPILTPVRGRLFVALLALAAALLLAAGCSNDSGGDKTPSVGQTPATGQTPAVGQTPSGGATAEIKAIEGTKWDTAELRIAADTAVEITADITAGFHAFAVFGSEAAAQGGEAPVAEAEACSAPCQQKVTVTLAAGEHYFRCQIHNSMDGTLIAE